MNAMSGALTSFSTLYVYIYILGNTFMQSDFWERVHLSRWELKVSVAAMGF